MNMEGRRKRMMVATIAILKKTLSEVRKSSEKLFQGEITLSKRDCWLIGTVLVLSGITIGLLKAPLTHGINITIGSHNGCNNGNNSANGNDGCGTDGKAGDMTDKLCKLDKKKEEAGKKNRSSKRENRKKRKQNP